MIRHSVRRIGFIFAVAALVSGAGMLLRAEPPQAVGTWASIGTAPENRVGAASVALADGRTIIAGGQINGVATDAVVVFDPNDGSFTSVGQLIAPRVGHTATLLEDGRFVIAGGVVNDLLTADLEIFDPASGTSTLAATMSGMRTGHAAARLGNGTVLLAGGASAEGVLQTAEIYDPESGTVAMTSSPLQTPRTGASATTLIDGRVLIAGGSNGIEDLASAEIFNPSSQSFEATDTNLDTPRSGNTAILLPHNNSVLIAGGSWNGVPQSTADLFLPAEFPDPYSYGMGQFAPTGAMVAPRSRAVGGASVEGYAFVVGGGTSEAEVYRFATIKTDKDDYAPGQAAIITGTGWEPNQEVTLLFQEDPAVHDDYLLTLTADDDGNIFYDQWAPERHDLGVRFYLMAKQADRRAQTTFTDGQPIVTNVSVTPFSPDQGSSAGVKDSTDITARNQGGGALTGFEIRIRSGSLISGPLVRTFTIGNLAANTSVVRTWDGKDAANAFVADGLYTARAFATTAGENDAANDVKQIVVDNTNPTVTLVAPTNGASVSGNFTLDASPLDAGGNDSNIDRVEFYVDNVLTATDGNPGGGWSSGNISSATFGNGIHTWFARAYDEAGNNADSGSRTFTVGPVDNTAPTTTISLNPAAPDGNNGWYKSNVHVSVAATDNAGGSGVAETRCVLNPLSAPATFDDIPAGCAYSGAGADVTTDGTHVVYAASKDTAGNTETVKNTSFKIDKTAPAGVVVNADRAADHNGWYNHAFTATWSGSDATSGIASCTVTNYSTPDTASGVISGSCTDNAGNTSGNVDFNFLYDATAPHSVTGAPNRPADHNGWYNHTVDVVFEGQDATSGIDSCDTVNHTGPDGTAVTADGSCTDNAGNTSAPTVSSAFDYDATAPINVTGAPNRAPDHDTWYNQAVDVVFDGQDATSGIDSCDSINYTGPDGMAVTVNGSCTDNAGNSSTPTASSAFNYDATAPIDVVVNADRTPDHNGWYNHGFTATWSGNDAASGIASCTVTPYSGPDTAAGVLGGSCTDNAGNTSGNVDFNFMYDASAPMNVSVNANRPPDHNGWYNHAFTATWSGNDAISGIASCTVTPYSGPDTAAGVVGGACTDNAGNASVTVNFNFMYDATAPTITFTSPGDGGTYLLNQVMAADYACADATSGVSSCAGPVADGASFNTSAVGPHSFPVNATDSAGNPASLTHNYSVGYAPFGTTCLGSPGHQVLQPINVDNSSVFKQKSTVPAKFRVCDANGVSVGTPGVVSTFKLVNITGTNPPTVNETVDSTTPDTAFRWSSTDQQWIFNINTKALSAGYRYWFEIKLNDGSTILFQFSLK